VAFGIKSLFFFQLIVYGNGIIKIKNKNMIPEENYKTHSVTGKLGNFTITYLWECFILPPLTK